MPAHVPIAVPTATPLRQARALEDVRSAATATRHIHPADSAAAPSTTVRTIRGRSTTTVLLTPTSPIQDHITSEAPALSADVASEAEDMSEAVVSAEDVSEAAASADVDNLFPI